MTALSVILGCLSLILSVSCFALYGKSKDLIKMAGTLQEDLKRANLRTEELSAEVVKLDEGVNLLRKQLLRVGKK